MSRSWVSSVLSLGLIALFATGGLFPAEAQLRGLRQAAERAAKRELERQVERAVTGMVRCALNDPVCMEQAEKDGDAVEITDEDGNVLRDANGHPISDPEYAKASRQEPGEGAWRNYDFVPGERILFHEDYASDDVGDFPQRLEFQAGNMEVVDSDGLRLLRVTSGSPRDAQFAIPLTEELAERFTLEFPVHWSARNLFVRVYFEADGAAKPPAGGTYQPQHLVVDHRETGVDDWQGDGPVATQAMREIHDGWVTVRLMADGDHVKAFVNEQRVANVPQAHLGRDSKIWFTMHDPTDEVPIYIGAITVAAGGRDLYDRLAAEGTIATRGILFATDSDEILPESTPTLEEIGQMLRDHPDLRLGITGHTDSEGGDEYNLDLSNRRAASVVRFLVEEFGVDRDRLESTGKGETEPVDTNEIAEGRANNRRVELSDLRTGTRASADVGTPSSVATPATSAASAQPADPPVAVRAESAGSAQSSAAVAALQSNEHGEITIVFNGDSRTLPVKREASGWSSPPGSDMPEHVRIALRAGDWPGEAVRGGGWSGDWRESMEVPVAYVRVDFDSRTLAVLRGQNQVSDSRVVDYRQQLARLGEADTDRQSDSRLSFTIEEYEVRDGSAYVRGRFDAPDTGMTGTFWGLLPRSP